MTKTLSHAEAQLAKRNELLEELWDLDAELRAWRTAGHSQQESVDMMHYRHELAVELKQMGCVPWEFDPSRDNSWLVKQRG